MSEDNAASPAERRLAEMGLSLPAVPLPLGLFCLGRIEGDLLFLSGQGPVLESGILATGKVGRDVTAEAARHHALRAGLVLVSAARTLLQDLGRVVGVVKLLGFVNATEDFDRHPFVVDGCSELMHGLFGDAGAHARSAIGVGSLPGGITVEVEAILRVAR
jgi:enamine deaminase RidA (YjgF/YER057c/UK114 family)